MAGVKPQPVGELSPAEGVACHAERSAGPDASARATAAIGQPAPRALPIVWQRLVKDGETCERCGSTHQEILAALAQLEPALRPLGLQPVLHTLVLDEPSFRLDPSASNHLWIDGRSVEDWLGARAGSSPCCSVCGDLPCRTLEVDGQSFDAVPRHLIVKAALIAAAAAFAPSRSGAGPASCCAGESPDPGAGRCAKACD
jgi:Domain of unknown function (DUF2703)